MESEVYAFNYNNKKYEYCIYDFEHENNYFLIPIIKGEGGCYVFGEEIKYTPVNTYKFDATNKEDINNFKQKCVAILHEKIEENPRNFFSLKGSDYIGLSNTALSKNKRVLEFPDTNIR